LIQLWPRDLSYHIFSAIYSTIYIACSYACGSLVEFRCIPTYLSSEWYWTSKFCKFLQVLRILSWAIPYFQQRRVLCQYLLKKTSYHLSCYISYHLLCYIFCYLRYHLHIISVSRILCIYYLQKHHLYTPSMKLLF